MKLNVLALFLMSCTLLASIDGIFAMESSLKRKGRDERGSDSKRQRRTANPETLRSTTMVTRSSTTKAPNSSTNKVPRKKTRALQRNEPKISRRISQTIDSDLEDETLSQLPPPAKRKK